MNHGLYAKYTITNNATGEVVSDAFVLKPATDRAARTALSIYGDMMREEGNEQLARDIETWVFDLDLKEDTEVHLLGNTAGTHTPNLPKADEALRRRRISASKKVKS